MLALEAGVIARDHYSHPSKNNQLSQIPCHGSYAHKNASGNRRPLTAVYGSMPSCLIRKPRSVPIAPRPTEADALLGARDQHSSQSETDSDSDGSCTAGSTRLSLQSILRIPTANFSCRSVKKQVSVDFTLNTDEDNGSKQSFDGPVAPRCMPRRLTLEEKAALYRVRPDLELVPTVLLFSEFEEMRRQRQRKLMFSILGASLLLLLMIVFYYLVSQM